MNSTRPQSAGKMGLWMTMALVVGNIIGSGVYLLPASLGSFGGISVFGWLFTSVGALLLALVFARLSRMVPKAGGPYAFSRSGFGDFAGFLVAWGYWISIWAANAALGVALVSYLSFFFPILSQNRTLALAVALGSIWLLTWVNSRGVRTAGSVQVVTTLLKIAPLILIGTLGLLYLDPANFTPFNASGGSSFSAITATAALTLWAFLGFESATVPAEEVFDPGRTIPRATILGTLFAVVLYVLGTVAVMGVIPPAELARSNAPFADAAVRMWGEWTGALVAAGAAVSCFGALNGWILLQGRVPFAAARDGLFPAVFGRLSRRGTPAAGLAISSVILTALMVMNYTESLVDQFTFIILLATLTALFPYAISAMAELMIFIRERERFRGERLAGASAIAVAAFLYSLWAIAGSGRETVYWGFLLLLAGVPVYVWIRWRQDGSAAAAEHRSDPDRETESVPESS
jgi:APA family basic amino acid/polyamine antiporter